MERKRLLQELSVAYSTLNRLLDDRFAPKGAIEQAKARCNALEQELDYIALSKA
jgi:hypothetical protein